MNLVWVLFVVTIYTGGDEIKRGFVSFETEEQCQEAVKFLQQSRPWESVVRMKFVCQKTPNR